MPRYAHSSLYTLIIAEVHVCAVAEVKTYTGICYLYNIYTTKIIYVRDYNSDT